MQQEEPSILEYARFHGLVRNHRDIDPLSIFQTPADLYELLEDPSSDIQIDASNITAAKERLQASKEVVQLLSSQMTPPQGPPIFEERDLIRTHKYRDMKVEPPILQRDHELDVLRFSRRITLNLDREHFPTEKIEEENDDGLSWPSRFSRVPRQTQVIAESEKLEVSKETMLWLQGVLKSNEGTEEQPSIDHDDLVHKKDIKLQCATPPLLPLSPITNPVVPSSDTSRLVFLSDRTSPTRQIAQDLEQSTMVGDKTVPSGYKMPNSHGHSSSALPNTEELLDSLSPSSGIREYPFLPPLKRVKIENRKIGGPITPPIPTPSKPSSVILQDSSLDVINKLPPAESTKNASSENNPDFFAGSEIPIATRVNRSLEQEQLYGANTMLRVEIPIMDFSIPQPPGELCSPDQSESSAQHLVEVIADHSGNHTRSDCRNSEHKLRWVSFPQELGKVAIDENIIDDGTASAIISQTKCVDSSSLIWKPEGLRIFDGLEDSEEENLEYGIFSKAKDVNSLVKKRRLDLPRLLELKETSISLENATPAHELEETGKSLESDKAFSALRAIDSFMDMRNATMKRSKPVESPYFAAPGHVPLGPCLARRAIETPIASDKPPLLMALPLFPDLDVSIPLMPRPFVVSSTSRMQKRLSRNIELLYPSAEFIERDFNLHVNDSILGSKAQEAFTSKPNDTMTDEADIILSPGTGLISTTIQKIKQRPLPGQSSAPPIRQRIAEVAPRYERLFVLLSEARQNEEDEYEKQGLPSFPDTRDCEALTEFVGYCSMLEGEVHIIIVPGGEKYLAKRIIELMAKYSVSSPDMKLLQDETLWELFLRRAGMNAFAAQVLLSEFKVSEGEEAISERPYRHANVFGLMRFLTQSVVERLRSLEQALGGREVLFRVSRRLDAKW